MVREMPVTTLLNEARAQRILRAEGIDGLLAACFENVYYTSGFWNENFFVLPRQTQAFVLLAQDALRLPHIVAGLGEAANIAESVPQAAVYLYGTFFRAVSKEHALTPLELSVKERVVDGTPFASVVDATVAAVDAAGLGRGTIAYDERGIFPENVAELQKRLSGARLVPGWSLFRRIRAVKTAEEVRRLQRALALNERAMLAAMRLAHAGVSEQEMIEEFERTVVGAGGKTLFTQIAFGRRGGHGNVMRRDATLRHDEFIRFDVGCSVDGYASDIARNFGLSEPDRRTRELYRAVLHGQEVAAKALKPGVSAREVFEAGVRAIREAGIPGYARHHIGHGIGLEVYDIPTLTPTDETVIEEGMVFEVETPYYELGYGGLQPEDTVLVTPDGGRFLNSISREFEVWA